MTIIPIDYFEVMCRLIFAVLTGCAIGINRNLHGKPTGIKTMGLVAFGAAVVTVASMDFAVKQGEYDMVSVSRAMQGIIIGIGFLGAGVIIHNHNNEQVYGLTTAASIWVTAALGIVCGMGMWPVALGSVIVILLLFIVGREVEKRLLDRWARKTPEEKETLTKLE